MWSAGGDVGLAAQYAVLDSSLDHGPEGITGEVFFAVMQTLVLAGADVDGALREALTLLDRDTETARAVSLVVDNYDAGTETWACRDRLLQEHGLDNFTHAPLNVGLTAWALLYGADDFEQSILPLPAPLTGRVDLAALPGTIELVPLDGSGSVLWANGEMPDAVKRAGGAAWQWRPGAGQAASHDGTGERRHAPVHRRCFSCKLPARSAVCAHAASLPPGSQVKFVPTKATHTVRLELASADPAQQASVLLSLPNFHLTAWTGETLPCAAV